MSNESKFSVIRLRDGRPVVNWGVYATGLVLAILATLTLNLLLWAAGVWSGVDTVLFGTLVAAIVFNIVVIREFSKPRTVPRPVRSAAWPPTIAVIAAMEDRGRGRQPGVALDVERLWK
jgi:hypothetical protein